MEDRLSLVEGNESVCERVDSLEKLDCFVDEDVKQATLKLTRLRRWFLNSQKKVFRANPRTTGDRSMLDLMLFEQIFEVFEELYSACFFWRSLTLNVVKDQS
ncbi:hypothetical protein V6N13_139681 [Hibiscus sabdariffa]|uniref:Uncharacterized protein n=2 Tax=Hibiscus sabdariffa TaxID=183260 RepID=A0ABR2C7H0_9ROSI